MRETMLRWQRMGSGEPLLLLHGLGSTRDDFAGLAPRLAREYEVLSVDLPGHGESTRVRHRPSVGTLTDIVASDLDQLGLGRVHVLGNSLGGRLGLELARRHRALSVVAVAPSGMGTPPERAYQGLAMSTGRVAMKAIAPRIERLSASNAGRRLMLGGLRARPSRASSAEAQAVKGGFAESTGFWQMLLWAVLADVPLGLRRIDCPVVLAQGTRDLISGGQTPRYLLVVPGSRFRPLSRAGHAPHSDSPDEIIRLVHEAVHRSKTSGPRVQERP